MAIPNRCGTRRLGTSIAPHVPGVFRYGRPEKGHGWQHVTNAELVEEMAAGITKHAPRGANAGAWKY